MERIVFSFTSIGSIRTPYRTLDSIPKSLGEAPTEEGIIEMDPAFAEGLLDIDGFSHLLVIFAFHQSTAKPLKVIPPKQKREKGVFATRSPHRPNGIGVLTVELLRREGNRLFVRGVDVLDGTPVLDLKPYLKHFDSRPEATQGWLDQAQDAS